MRTNSDLEEEITADLQEEIDIPQEEIGIQFGPKRVPKKVSEMETGMTPKST